MNSKRYTFKAEELSQYFNKVEGMTAICRSTRNWLDDYSDVLEVGKTYNVTYIGVQRSITIVMLEGCGYRGFSHGCFDLYDNGFRIGPVNDFRYWAPYLRKMYDSKSLGWRSWEIRNDKGTIRPHIEDIEKEFGVKVLHASLSGSRLWGWNSPESDFDICFVYLHCQQWYESNDNSHETVVKAYADGVDMLGYDIRNFLSQLAKGNPMCFETLRSQKLFRYNSKFYEELKDIADGYFKPLNAMYYYLNLYLSNERSIKDGTATSKQLLYSLRGLLSYMWIEKFRTLPSMKISALSERTIADPETKMSIARLVGAKQRLKEHENYHTEERLSELIDKLSERYKGIVGDYKPEEKPLSDYKELQGLFNDILQEGT